MGGGDEQAGDGVFILGRHARPALAAARLGAEAFERGPLDIALDGDGDDHLLALDQILVIDAVGGGGDFRQARGREFALDRLELLAHHGVEFDPVPQYGQIFGDRVGQFGQFLADREKLYAVLKQELVEVRDLFATPRLSEIAPAADGIEDEDLIEREEMVVTVTLDGYIKRTPLETFRAQRRGGKGRAGMATKEEDAVSEMFVTSTHTPVLFFSTAGKVYRLKVWRLPEGGPATRGRPIVNLLPALDQGETIATVLPLPEDEAEWGKLNVVFATAKGNVRRNSMDAFANIPSNGKFAMRFDEDSEDRLIGVALLDPGDDVLLASRQGKAIRFAGEDVREFQSRTSTGVRGMLLKGDDEVISLSILHRVGVKDQDEREDYLRHAPWKAEKDSEPSMTAERFAELAAKEQFILTVCANGYGKLSSAYEYRRTGRGGQGITNIDNIGRNGPVVASFPASQADQLMLVTDQAKLIRLGLDSLRVIGRGSAGVRLFNVANEEHVVSAVRLADTGDEEGAVEGPEEDGGEVEIPANE